MWLLCIKLKYNVTEIKLSDSANNHWYSDTVSARLFDNERKEWSSLEQFIVVDANEPQRPYQQDLNEKVNRNAQGID